MLNVLFYLALSLKQHITYIHQIYLTIAPAPTTTTTLPTTSATSTSTTNTAAGKLYLFYLKTIINQFSLQPKQMFKVQKI